MPVKSFFRILRIIAAITLFFFSWSFLPLWQAVAYATTPQGQGSGKQTTAANRPPTTGDRFEKALESIRENISKADEKSSKGQDVGAEIEAIKTKRADIESADVEFKKEFAATEKKLKDAKLPKEILDRHYKFVKHYENNLKELRANLDGIEQAKTTSDRKAKITKARLHLEKVKAPSKHQKLDPNNLPFKARTSGKKVAPRLKKEDFERDFPQQKSPRTADLEKFYNSAFRNPNSALNHKPILLAFNEPASDVPFQLPRPVAGEGWGERATQQFAFADSAPFLLAQATTTDTPTTADLAETPEVQFTQDIKDLAAQLGNNSLRIFEAVRNNYRYEPYYGSLKGAQQTLREKAGNDFDLASLLISLYRATGIPAHYVIATISMPLPQAQSWLGIDDPKMVGRLLASAGVPVAVDYISGNIRIEHIFVQAWVPFQNGRGALNGTGDTWVYMDPSFKDTKVTQILNQTIPAFDQTQYLNQLRPVDPSEYYSGLVQENLNTTSPGRTVYAVAQHREIVPLNFGMLLGMPQYDIIATGGYFQEIPNQFRYTVTFELTDPETLETSLTYQASTVELAAKRVTLSYSPATTNDQTIISNYGDIYSTPCYLIELRPELKFEGATIAQGLPIGSASMQPFTMKFISPMGGSEQVMNNAVAGAYYAVAIDLQTVTQGMIYERTQKLRTSNDIIVAGGSVSLDDHAGELLYATALTYFQKLDAANRKAQELLKINDLRGISEAIFSIDVQAAYLFGMPKSVDVSSVHIDVDRDIHLPIPVDGNTERIKEYNLLIGSNSSYFEHKVIEDIYPTEAISAVKGLQLAIAQGIQVYTINTDNINSIMPSLQIRSEILADIVNAVNAGKEVIVPQREILLNSWMGVGYIAMNPLTGEAGYIISGGLAGGDSTIPLTTYIKAQALSGNVAADKEMAAIENSIERDVIIFPGPDNSIGTGDDVRLVVADEYKVTEPITGPPNTKCAGKFSDTYYAPDYDLKAPLLELQGMMDKNLTKLIKVSDMVGNSGSSSYGRISSGFLPALDYYIQTLKDANMTPTISSGYRTWYHNCELPKSAINSNHIDGIAADVLVGEKYQSRAATIALLMFGPVGGVGLNYANFVHVDLGRVRKW